MHLLEIRQIIIELSTTFLAAVVGLVLIKRLLLFHKVLLLQVYLYILADLLSVTYQLVSHTVYNIYLPLETILITIACFVTYKSKALRFFSIFIFTCYLVVYVYDAVQLSSFYHHAAICTGVVTTVNCLLLLFEEMANEKEERSLSKTLAIVGMLLYSACTIPYMALMFYFQKTNPQLNQMLWGNIIILLASLRYLLLALSFLFVLQKPRINHERSWSA